MTAKGHCSKAIIIMSTYLAFQWIPLACSKKTAINAVWVYWSWLTFWKVWNHVGGLCLSALKSIKSTFMHLLSFIVTCYSYHAHVWISHGSIVVDPSRTHLNAVAPPVPTNSMVAVLSTWDTPLLMRWELQAASTGSLIFTAPTPSGPRAATLRR